MKVPKSILGRWHIISMNLWSLDAIICFWFSKYIKCFQHSSLMPHLRRYGDFELLVWFLPREHAVCG
jgi:hypothetical protein